MPPLIAVAFLLSAVRKVASPESGLLPPGWLIEAPRVLTTGRSSLSALEALILSRRTLVDYAVLCSFILVVQILASSWYEARYRRRRSVPEGERGSVPRSEMRRTWLYSAFALVFTLILLVIRFFLAQYHIAIWQSKKKWTRPLLLAYWALLGSISVAGWNRQLSRSRKYRPRTTSVHPGENVIQVVPVSATQSQKATEGVPLASPTGALGLTFPQLPNGTQVATDLLDAADKHVPTLGVNARRKFFHGLAVAMFLPGVAVDPAFTHLSFSAAFALFIFAEYVRYFAVYPFGAAVHLFMNEFLDQKDSGTAILSHFYLLMGCAGAVWLEGPSQLDQYTGILALGVGDAMASIIGKRIGRYRWFAGSPKTVEGSLAFVFSLVLCAWCLRLFGLVDDFSMSRYAAVVTLVSVLEGFTDQNDNLTLPLYMWSMLVVVDTGYSLTVFSLLWKIHPRRTLAGSSKLPFPSLRTPFPVLQDPSFQMPVPRLPQTRERARRPSRPATASIVEGTSIDTYNSDYDWATFMTAYASGQWNPHKTPNPPRPILETPLRSVHVSFSNSSSSSLSVPKAASIAQSTSNSLISGSAIVSSPVADSTRGEGSHNNHENSQANSASTPDKFHPETCSTFRIAINISPLALPSPEHELTDPMRGVHAAIPGSHPSACSPQMSQATPSSGRKTRLGSFWEGTQDVGEDVERLPTIQASNSNSPSLSDIDEATPATAPINRSPEGHSEEDYFTVASARTNSVEAHHRGPTAELSSQWRDYVTLRRDSEPIDLNVTSAPALPRRVCLTRQTSSPLPETTARERLLPGGRSVSDTLSGYRIGRAAKEEQMFTDLGYLAPPNPPDELERRTGSRGLRFNIWNTAPDINFDRIAHLVKLVFNTKIVLISLLDGTEQCDEPTIVLDTHTDWRFAKNPLVIGSPYARFYAGAPLRTQDGYNIGSLSLMDDSPRSDFTPRQRHTLKEFAAIVMREMELWRDKIQLRIRDKIQTSMEHFSRECLEIDQGESRKSDIFTSPSMDKVYDRAAKLVKRTLDISEGILPVCFRPFIPTHIQYCSEMMLADQAKSLFISNISHELRTPLHGILAAAELLADTPLSHSQTSFLHTVQACGTSLVETVNHVLDFTKLSGNVKSGGVDNVITRSRVDLEQLVEEAIDGSWIGYCARTSALREQSVEIVVDIDRREGASACANHPASILISLSRGWTLKCDKGGIRRVLMNLFGNSLKFTSRGYVHVSLRQASPLEDANNGTVKIELCVSDTGKGISQNFLKNHLFHPFSQENPLQTGTGLGLAIVHSIVRSPSVAGKVEVVSEEGVGTEIKVIFEAETLNEPNNLHEPFVFEDLDRQPVLSLLGFKKRGRGTQLLHDVICKYLRSWWGFALHHEGEELGDIVIVNEDPSPVVTALEKTDTSRSFIILSSSRGSPRVMGICNAYENNGGVCRIVHKPGGPFRLRAALKQLLRARHRRRQRIASYSSAVTASEDTVSLHSAMLLDDLTGSERRRRGSMDVWSTNPRSPPVPPMSSPELSYSTIADSERDSAFQTLDIDLDSINDTNISVARGVSEIMPRQSASSTTGGETHQVKRVLVVEDNSILRSLLIKWLTKKSFDCREATDGREGVNIFKSEGPFESVLKSHITIWVGATVEIRQIERSRTTQRPCAILALTGMSSLEDKRKAFEAGMDGYLVKPVAFKTLDDMFHNLGLS
ncbi:histidine kinase [Pisolithus croceorrhizus]|nr:histidine kinase [Pisolithus croceorrhizus]